MQIFYLLSFLWVGNIFQAGIVFGCNSTMEGITWDFDNSADVLLPGVESVDKCLQNCQQDPDCQGFTWTYSGVMDMCYIFKFPRKIHECENCVSGLIPRELSGGCSDGADDIMDVLTAQSVDECFQLCSDNMECHAYTWWNETSLFPNSCFLLQNCKHQHDCKGCISGSMNCISSLPPQCTDYKILDEGDRSARNNNGDCGLHTDCKCDSGNSGKFHGAGYYRFQEPAGIIMPESTPGPVHCQAYGSGFLKGTHPTKMGREEDMVVCFDNFFDGNCNYQDDVTVTLCDGYYVYYLPNASHCNNRYCGITP